MWKKVWDFLTGWMKRGGKGRDEEPTPSPSAYTLDALGSEVEAFFPGEVVANTVILLAGTQEGGSEPPVPPVPVTHYAAPTAQGLGDGSSPANAFTVASFVALPPSPGDHLQLADGTYTGASSQLTAIGINGTSAANIRVSCATDGGATFDGQDTLAQIVDLNNSDYWYLTGFNVHSCTGRAIRVRNTASYNTLSRIVAWDVNADSNSAIFSIGNDTAFPCYGNLVVDCAGFGYGQRIFESAQGAEDTVFRRCWFMGHTWKAIQFGYQAHGNLVENCIGTWNSLGHSRETLIESRGTHGIGRIDKGVGGAALDQNSQSKMYGCISYVLAESDITATDGSKLSQLFDVHGTTGGITVKDFVGVWEHALTPQNQTLAILRDLAQTTPTSTFNDVTLVKGVSDTGYARTNDSVEVEGSGWSVSNVDVQTTVAGISSPFQASAGTGARVYYRYVDGTLTSDLLWPWPMDSRIRAALTARGDDPDTLFRGTGNGVTELMENIFGTIPGI